MTSMAFWTLVKMERNINSDHDVKVSLNGGGGFLKICLSVMENTHNGSVPCVRSRYSEGIAAHALKDTGVKRIMILSIAPETQENYSNILRLWILIQLIGPVKMASKRLILDLIYI